MMSFILVIGRFVWRNFGGLKLMLILLAQESRHEINRLSFASLLLFVRKHPAFAQLAVRPGHSSQPYFSGTYYQCRQPDGGRDRQNAPRGVPGAPVAGSAGGYSEPRVQKANQG